MGIEEIVIAPRSPWQNPSVERLIGSIRRECLGHAIVFHEQHLTRILTRYFASDHEWRTHVSLAMDGPEPQPMQRAKRGKVIAVPELGGLHHHYERLVA
jgi:transposase InsO family protein